MTMAEDKRKELYAEFEKKRATLYMELEEKLDALEADEL